MQGESACLALTLGVLQGPLGLGVILDDVVQDKATGNDGSGNQNLQSSASADEARTSRSATILHFESVAHEHASHVKTRSSC